MDKVSDFGNRLRQAGEKQFNFEFANTVHVEEPNKVDKLTKNADFGNRYRRAENAKKEKEKKEKVNEADQCQILASMSREDMMKHGHVRYEVCS